MFLDEPDEDDRLDVRSLALRPEPDEEDRQPSMFQQEEDEPDEETTVFVQNAEPDEPDQEVDSSLDEESDCSAYHGDVDESAVVANQRPIFEIGFQVMNRFLSSQLKTVSDQARVSAEQPKKKRCYNNAKRSALAAAAKAAKPPKSEVRLARNHPETSLTLVDTFKLFLFIFW